MLAKGESPSSESAVYVPRNDPLLEADGDSLAAAPGVVDDDPLLQATTSEPQAMVSAVTRERRRMSCPYSERRTNVRPLDPLVHLDNGSSGFSARPPRSGVDWRTASWTIADPAT